MLSQHTRSPWEDNVDRAEPNRRYLTYLASLAVAATPLVLPVVSATVASAAPVATAEVSADKAAALKSAAARISHDGTYGPSQFTECFIGPNGRICFG
jgi:hypothetical protein